MITTSQQTINNFCMNVNRIMPTALMNMVEIEPISIEQTSMFAKWFRRVLCIREFEDQELLFWQENLREHSNILICNITPLEAFEKFKDDAFIDFIFFNNDLHIDFISKVFDNGFISGKGKQNKFKQLKTEKGFWLAKKE